MGLVRAWYGGAPWLHVLRPLEWLFRMLAAIRRGWLRRRVKPAAIPVLVVGNISVGGTGKTPVVLALARALQQRGLRPGILSRGYGGRARQYPYFVQADSDVRATGDEALMMRRQFDGPLVLDPQRARGLAALERSGACDVVICDDGLQHYRLWRDMEVVVIDATRGLGNGRCLPAGPLREPPGRLQHVDAVILNGGADEGALASLHQLPRPPLSMTLVPRAWVNVKSGQRVSLANFMLAQELEDSHSPVTAIAGIGNPQRFFDTVQALQITVTGLAFSDHHAYQPRELAFARDTLLLMTEKDAVKCRHFAADNWWYLEVAAQLPEVWLDEVAETVKRMQSESIKRPQPESEKRLRHESLRSTEKRG